MASVWNDILTSVGNLIDAATTTTVVVRRSGETLPGDTYPLWLVCPAGEETVVEYAWTKQVHYRYPVAALYVAAANRDFTVGTTLLTERETIRQVLDRVTLSGASTVINCEVKPLPPCSYVDGTTFDVSGFGLIYDSWETRTNG